MLDTLWRAVLDGLGMLVNQGVIGFRLWTGRDPNPTVMRRALEEILRPSLLPSPPR